MAYEPSIYTGGGLLELVQRTDAEAQCLLMIGHNPCIHQCAASLAEYGNESDISALHRMFPPASLAVLHFSEAAWHQVTPEAAPSPRFYGRAIIVI